MNDTTHAHISRRFHGYYFFLLAFISTGLNLACGLIGIYLTVLQDLRGAFQFLIAGAFFDLFDGMFARRSPVKSSLGIYADSFADLFTFALLPAYMILQANIYLGSVQLLGILTLDQILASIYSICGWFRLIRFSVHPTGPLFEGLPSSAAAMLIGSLTVITTYFPDIVLLNVLLTIALICVSLLMVSTIAYPSPKRMLKPDNLLLSIGSFIGLIYVFIPNILSAILAFIIFLLYVSVGPYYYIKTEKLFGPVKNK